MRNFVDFGLIELIIFLCWWLLQFWKICSMVVLNAGSAKLWHQMHKRSRKGKCTIPWSGTLNENIHPGVLWWPGINLICSKLYQLITKTKSDKQTNFSLDIKHSKQFLKAWKAHAIVWVCWLNQQSKNIGSGWVGNVLVDEVKKWSHFTSSRLMRGCICHNQGHPLPPWFLFY